MVKFFTYENLKVIEANIIINNWTYITLSYALLFEIVVTDAVVIKWDIPMVLNTRKNRPSCINGILNLDIVLKCQE